MNNRNIKNICYIITIIYIHIVFVKYENFIYSNNFIDNCKYNITTNNLYQYILCNSLLWLYIILLISKNIIYFYIICEVHPY